MVQANRWIATSILGSGALCWYIGLDKFAPNITELLGLEDSAGGGVDADKIQALERQIASLRKLAKDLLLAQEESLRWSSISRGVLHLGLFGTAVYCINQRKDNFKRLSRRYASAALQLQQFLSPYVGIKLVSDEFLVSLGDSLDSSLSSVSSEASPQKFNPTSPGGKRPEMHVPLCTPGCMVKSGLAKSALSAMAGVAFGFAHLTLSSCGCGSPGAANRGVAELAILVDTRCQQIETKTDALRRDMMTEIRKGAGIAQLKLFWTQRTDEMRTRRMATRQIREAAGLQAPKGE